MNEWIKTDDYQYVKKIDDGIYKIAEVIGVNWIEEEKPWGISYTTIDLEDWSKDEIIDHINGYGYENIEKVKKLYGDDYEQIIAECIAECNHDSIGLSFTSEDEALEHIEKEIITEQN